MVVFLVNTFKTSVFKNKTKQKTSVFKQLIKMHFQASPSNTCQDTVSYVPFKGLQMKGKAAIDRREIHVSTAEQWKEY